MKACMHKIPTGEGARATSWPPEWPVRVESTPSWLSSTEKGVYGKPAAEDFQSDAAHWRRVVAKSYIQGLEIDWNSVRKVMDMKAGYGGYALTQFFFFFFGCEFHFENRSDRVGCRPY